MSFSYNAGPPMPRWIPALVSIALVACAGSTPAPTAAATPTLRPRASATTQPAVVRPAVSTPLATPGPSPTPLIHVVEQGDTLLGIAIIYGVDLADLVLANPDVNPRFLSVGTGLLIPTTGVQSTAATATPYPLTLSPTRCFPELDGGLWCLTLASTPNGPPVEAVVALINLIDAQGATVRTEPAFSPINLLEAQSALPLAAYFAPPVPDHTSSSAVLISALQATEVERRYPRVELEIDQQRVAPDRYTGQVAGTVRLADPQATLESGLRLVAVVLDAQGNPAGYRVWERDPTAALTEGVPFALTVASLGPPIEELLVLVEAR